MQITFHHINDLSITFTLTFEQLNEIFGSLTDEQRDRLFTLIHSTI